MNKNKVLIISSLVVIGLFSMAAYFLNNEEANKSTVSRISQDQLVKFHSRSLGNQNAKVTVVEFYDPECESCAAFYPELKKLVETYKEDVRFVSRYMIYHGNSKLAAIATEAAGKQGKYWEMQKLLFTSLDWTHQQTPQTEKFISYAKSLDLDVVRFAEDMNDPSLQSIVESDFEEGKTIGVTGTPTFYVNGRMLQEFSYTGLRKLIEEEINISK